MVTYEEFLKRLRALRKERGVKGKELAFMLNIDRTSYVNRENGKTIFTLPEAMKIVDFFKVSWSDLFEKELDRSGLTGVLSFWQTLSEKQRAHVITLVELFAGANLRQHISEEVTIDDRTSGDIDSTKRTCEPVPLSTTIVSGTDNGYSPDSRRIRPKKAFPGGRK